jgi:putative ABC transport system permease protein
VARRFLDASLGDSLDALDEPLRIVGIFEADDCAAESEVWTDLHGLAQISGESGFVSSVQLRAASREDLGALQQRLSTDSQFGLKAMTEGEYFASQFVTGLAIKTVGRIISLFLIIAAMFAIANTMFSAMESRAREIGTLRALGFSRSRIMFAVLFESLVLCLLGSGLGCLGTLPLNGLATGTANWVTFSELTFLFRLGPALLIKGALLACLMGVTGGLLPAIRAIRMNTIVALREY